MAETILIFLTSIWFITFFLMAVLALERDYRRVIVILITLAVGWILFGDVYFLLTGKANFVVWPLRPLIARLLLASAGLI